MPSCLLYRRSPKRRPRYYRVDIVMTLFEEVSVLREWGIAGGKGRVLIDTFTNLRDASRAADRHRLRAKRRGYGKIA